MSSTDSRDLFSLMSQKISSGGRLAYWNLYNDRFPDTDNSRLTILEDTSQELQKIDRVFFFKFYVCYNK